MDFKNYTILIFIMLTFVNFLQADYLYQEGDICITAYKDKWNGCKITKSSDGSKETINGQSCDDLTFLDGYIYDSAHDTCNKLPVTASDLGMTEEDFNFTFALLGSLVGFTWFFFITMLATFTRR